MDAPLSSPELSSQMGCLEPREVTQSSASVAAAAFLPPRFRRARPLVFINSAHLTACPSFSARLTQRPLRLYKRGPGGAFSPLGSLAERPPVPGLQPILSGDRFILDNTQMLQSLHLPRQSPHHHHFSLPPRPFRPPAASIAVCRRRRASLFCLAWPLPFIRTTNTNKAESKHTQTFVWMSPAICWFR